MGIADGEFARVTSRRGSIELEAHVSHRETPGSCFIPFHFREAAANLLTIDEIDPFGKIPEFKFCAVRVEPAACRRVEAQLMSDRQRPRPRARGARREVRRSEPHPVAERRSSASTAGCRVRSWCGSAARRAGRCMRSRG